MQGERRETTAETPGTAGDGEPRPSEDGDAPRRERLEFSRDPGDRLDRILSDRLELSRTQAADLITEGRVRVGGRRVKKSYEPRAGDVVEVEIPAPESPSLEPQALPVEVVYEDDHLAVVEKPAGMVVHPAPGHPDGTLVNALLARLDRLSSKGGDVRPGIVHRLDMDTSGLLVVAKRDPVHLALSRALARREVSRGYLASTWGRLDEDGGTVDAPVGRDPSDRRLMAVVEDGKRAVTRWRRLETWRSAELMAVRLETGRTHQIRVHFRHLGHPVVGDPLYAEGWEKGFVGAGGRWARELARRAGRLFLHAARLSFTHPVTGEELSFTSELPEPLGSAAEWARISSHPDHPDGRGPSGS